MNIIEIQSMREVLEHLTEGAHLFLDLDYTVLTTVHDFGSGSWEVFLINHFMREGVPEKEALDRASDIWKAVQVVSPVKIVEEETVEILRRLQKEYPVMGLTARSLSLKQVTEDQLASLGVNLRHGIIYCGDFSKGEMVKQYVGQNPCSRIVVVDDLRGHLESIAEHVAIPFTGLRYGYLDHHKNTYAPDEISLLLNKLFNHPEASHYLRGGLAK